MPKHTMMKRLKEVQARLLAGDLDAEIAAANEVMTAEELPSLLGIPHGTLLTNRWRYDIPYRQLGRRLLFSRDAIREWLRRKIQERVWIDPYKYPREAALAQFWIRK